MSVENMGKDPVRNSTSNNGRNQPVTPVKFAWKSTDGGQQGTMAATLPNAVYQGPFFQITRQIKGDVLTPLSAGWNDGWDDWPYWGDVYQGDYDTMQFITQYSGKVMANLSNPGGKQMRCRFYLMEPASGMSGGGQGECQLSGRRTIYASFDPS
jgi:hypothetical protein